MPTTLLLLALSLVPGAALPPTPTEKPARQRPVQPERLRRSPRDGATARARQHGRRPGMGDFNVPESDQRYV